MNAVITIEGILLVLSNLFLLPAIFLAYKLNLVPETSILTLVMTVSIIYHLCQTGFFCIVDFGFPTLQMMDHFFVYSAFTWMLLYLSEMTLQNRFAVFIWLQALLLPFLVHFFHLWWIGGFLISLVVIIIIFLLAFVIKRFPSFNVVDMILVIVLIGIGFALHIFSGNVIILTDEDEDDLSHRYPIYHTIWHVLAMLAIYYVIDLKQGNNWIARKIYGIFENPDDDEEEEDIVETRSYSKKSRKKNGRKKNSQNFEVLTLGNVKPTRLI